MARRRCGSCTAAIEDLADAGVDGPFDGILAAYLVRNLADPDAPVAELPHAAAPGRNAGRARVLGARFSGARCATWNAVCWGIIIPSGRLRTGDATLYRHLWRSVHDVRRRRRLPPRLRAAGFVGVHSETVPGWQRNIVHTFLARHREHQRPRRDPRRVTHPAQPGLPDAAQLTARPRAVVVGAGIAGLAAATGLAERGVASTSSNASAISAAGSAAGPRPAAGGTAAPR